MPRDVRVFLWDVIEAANSIQQFVKSATADDYCGNAMMKAAVERKLEIIGEALGQSSRHFPDIVEKISYWQQIVALRNRLIHGYSAVSDSLLWDIIENDLPKLKSDAELLLREYGGELPRES